MGPIGTRVDKRVQELYSVAIFNVITSLRFETRLILLKTSHVLHPCCLVRVSRDNIKYFNFVKGGFLVVRRTFLHFQSDVGVVLGVTGQPDG